MSTKDLIELKHSASNSLSTFYNADELSDCEVAADDGKIFKCHKLVLASSSPVWRAMFASDMTESRSQRVQIGAADSAVLELLLQYMYGQTTKVTAEMALEFFMLADQYQVEAATLAVRHELQTVKLSPQTTCQLLPKAINLSVTLGSAVAAAIAARFTKTAAEALSELAKEPLFLEWAVDVVQQVLQHPDAAPYDALVAAAAWANAAPGARLQQHWPQLLQSGIGLQLFKLSLQQLQQVREQQAALLDLPGLSRALFVVCLEKLEVQEYDAAVAAEAAEAAVVAAAPDLQQQQQLLQRPGQAWHVHHRLQPPQLQRQLLLLQQQRQHQQGAAYLAMLDAVVDGMNPDRIVQAAEDVAGGPAPLRFDPAVQ